MELDNDAYQIIAEALTEGQGGFTEEDFEIACSEIIESMVKGQFAALVLEGQLSIKIENGEMKCQASARGRADLENQLAARGISLEQLQEELRRGR